MFELEIDRKDITKIDDDFNFKCLFETCHYTSVDGKEHFIEYYEYDIKKDILKELTEEEYLLYKAKGAWSNLVFNKQQIEKMIENAMNSSHIYISRRIEVFDE